MAVKATSGNKEGESKRLNRTVGLSEAIGHTLDAALKRRGFASRDILRHWATMAPQPYDRLAQPDRLVWPRGARGTEGATLYLRCAEGQGLALIHEAPRIAASINRYFGYVLVNAIRLSPEPLQTQDRAAPALGPDLSPEARERLASTLSDVSDSGLREALEMLGAQLASKGER